MDWRLLMDDMLSGSVHALSRLISFVENREPGWCEAMKKLYPLANRAATIGITGHPGSGKSTLTAKLVRELVDRGHGVGVVAVDPSMSVEDAMAVVTEKRCRHLPVMDGDTLAGVVSSGDLTKWMTRHHQSHIQDLVNYITGKYPV